MSKKCIMCGGKVPSGKDPRTKYCGEKCKRRSAAARRRGDDDKPFAPKPKPKEREGNWSRQARKSREDITRDYPDLLAPTEHSLRFLEQLCAEADSYPDQAPVNLANTIRLAVKDIQDRVYEEWHKAIAAQVLTFEEHLLAGVDEMEVE